MTSESAREASRRQAETVDERLRAEDLLDAYITGTNVSDWEMLIDYLEAHASTVRYFNGNDPTERPEDLEPVLAAASSFAPGYSMAIDLGGDVVRSFFFDAAEIDFNFRVRNSGEPPGVEVLESPVIFQLARVSCKTRAPRHPSSPLACGRRARLFQTPYASPQLGFGQPDDGQWYQIARQPYERRAELLMSGTHQLAMSEIEAH